MTLAIVHYHLEPGGVSNVIITTSRTLSAAGIPHVILVSSASDESLASNPIRIVPGLAYQSANDRNSSEALTKQLQKTATEALGAPPEIWHFHNHSLGKNPLVPQVVASLAENRERMLLQIHDLAEDGRLENLKHVANCRNLYPISPGIHYAFLNSRDRQRFIHAGLPPENAHLLANPVPTIDLPKAPPFKARPPLMLYPVRGIRRKNLGEFILLSVLAPTGTRAAVTRAPKNPRWRRIHGEWESFATSLGLPIQFNVVDRVAPANNTGTSFHDWLQHASHLLTTSVAEGFGMVFLEAIAAGKPLLGRELPHLTADHASHGIRTGHFYERILIPDDWIGMETLEQHLRSTLTETCTTAGKPLPNNAVETTRESLRYHGFLDFGNLPESLQQLVIRRVGDPANLRIPLIESRGHRRPAAEWLAETLAETSPTAEPSALNAYSTENHLATLSAITGKLKAAPPSPPQTINQQKILDAYLTPQTFHFLTSPKTSHCPLPRLTGFRTVVFDVYGTLLAAPAGGVKHDPSADPVLRTILADCGFQTPASPSAALHAAVRRHHAISNASFPEIDLRILWREVLQLPSTTDTTELVIRTEAAWHPAKWLPGAKETLRNLATADIPTGLLSNAQCNTLPTLEEASNWLSPDLCILSYCHGIAKPSPRLFQLLAQRLAKRGIMTSETLFIGNDPLQDIAPAAAAGFRTALFTGHPDSLRHGSCFPDFEITSWSQFQKPQPPNMRDK